MTKLKVNKTVKKKTIKKAIGNAKLVTEESLWPEPDRSLIEDTRHPAPVFPLEVFPPIWQGWIEKTAASKCCPIDFIAVNLLVVTSGVLGNARRGQAWEGWNQCTTLWSMIVGNPSAGKSPAMGVFVDVLGKIDKDLAIQHKANLKAHQQQKEVAELHAKEWQDKLHTAVKNGRDTKKLLRPTAAEIPSVPVRQRVMIADATIQEIGNILAKNNRGLLMMRDEIAGLIKTMNNPTAPDREFYLQSYDGSPYTIDRVKHEEPIIISSLAISINGNIQPDKLNALLMHDADDGFTGRFLYCYPEGVEFKRPTVPPDISLLKETLERLYALPMQKVKGEAGLQSVILPFTEEAATLFAEWRSFLSEKEKGTFGLLTSHLGKTPGFVIKLATVLTHLHKKKEPTVIGKECVAAAIRLVDDYFFPMAIRALGAASLPEHHRNARKLARWIIGEQPTLINPSHIDRMRDSPLRDLGKLNSAFDFLIESGWINFKGGRAASNAGRERQDYEVNPKVFKL